MSMPQDNGVSGTLFHFGFDGSVFIFPSLRITSWLTFTAACLITASICLSERYLTYLISTKWTPLKRKSPVAVSLFRSFMYWIATLERFTYMLITMSSHAGLILVTVTSLTIGQFFVELQEAKASLGATGSYHPLRESVDMDEPFTDPPVSLFPCSRGAHPEAAQLQVQTPVTTTSTPPRSALLTPTYRTSPRESVNSDIGTGIGRERARGIMGGEK